MRRQQLLIPTLTSSLLKQLIEFAEYRRRAYLLRVSKVRRAEAEALLRESERLRTQLGPDHPRPLNLKRAALGAEKFAEWAEETVGRAERSPNLEPGDWMLMGQIITRSHESTAGFSVGLSGQAGKFVRGFPKTKVNSRGEFYLVCRKERLAKFRRTQHRELFLKLADIGGKRLLHSTRRVRVEQGRVEYVHVKLARTVRHGRKMVVRKRLGKRSL